MPCLLLVHRLALCEARSLYRYRPFVFLPFADEMLRIAPDLLPVQNVE